MLGEPTEAAYGFQGVFMRERIIVASLLLVCAACAPHRASQSSPAPPLLRLIATSTLNPAVLESNDPNPGHFCFVGTKDCMTPSEMYGGFCLLSTGRCKSDAHAQVASEIVLPAER
jgi:hypothetical protein